MANKIKIDEDTYECPFCGYRWSRRMGMADLSFDEELKMAMIIDNN